MARWLQSRLKQSSTYAVSLATTIRKKESRLHRPHVCGSMRVGLFLSSGRAHRTANLDPMKALRHE